MFKTLNIVLDLVTKIIVHFYIDILIGAVPLCF